jgi:hypothetical protein
LSANPYVLQRLAGVRKQLLGAHHGGSSLSAATKGHERETFVHSFLSEVFPTPFRFGTGDVTDVTGAISGQVDVVIEYPFSPSLPIVGSATTRLYLAESVAAVIEVKSNVASQWDEALHTAHALYPISRSFGSTFSMGPMFARIPLFIVGYTGWKTVETVQSHLNAVAEISGILIIDQGIFASSAEFDGLVATGDWSLWGLIRCLHLATQSLKAASPDPIEYAV